MDVSPEGAVRSRGPAATSEVVQYAADRVDVGSAERAAAGGRPARTLVRRGVVVLERHLQGHGEATEGLGDVVATHREVGLAGLVVGIAVRGLEVRAGA